MSRVRDRGEEIRKFIVENMDKHSGDIAKVAGEKFGITRQAVNKHMQKLVSAGSLTVSGITRNRTYKLAPLSDWLQSYQLLPTLGEDRIWSLNIRGTLGNLPDNVMDIWQYGFTEMFNNAIDHSAGSDVSVRLVKTAAAAEMMISDNGVGIFKKIQTQLDLLDERHAILELSKGKLTTDPSRHSGEGIFFTSRMFDSFRILSGGVYFSHDFGEAEDWVLENEGTSGTTVFMKLHNHTARTTKKIFDQYSSGDDYGFNKTVVPVKLAQYGNDKLISRSQAKRLLARVDLFKTVLFNFTDVPTIGQAFADEIFRVFALQHKDIELIPIHANSDVKRMIARAKAGVPDESGG
jgi:biotin operon repressor